TAEGKPIVGGTYFPREDREVDREKVPGFKTILGNIQKMHKDKPKDLEDYADKLARKTAALLQGSGRGSALLTLDAKLVEGAVDELKERFDKLHGGFGNPRRAFRGPKFPQPSALALLHAEGARAKSKELGEMVALTLDRMARGGIYDHLGGGFHRYTVERTWTVPHFEKMLYDNAQLLELYARAHAKDKKPLYERVLRQTIAFVGRELTAPEGGFYSALDADSEGEEGRFYVWTAKEIQGALPAKADRELFAKV